MSLDPLFAISPLDGRYRATIEPLSATCSEYGLQHSRLHVEVEYFIGLAAHPGVTFLRSLTGEETGFLRGLVTGFDLSAAQRIKVIEAETRHDVKAVERYLSEQLIGTSLEPLRAGIHFGLTSEDINNLAYALLVRSALREVVLPALEATLSPLEGLAASNAALPMLARTHGQPATPTTLGKELAVFAARARFQQAAVEAALEALPGKLNGATGGFNAHLAAYPNVDWIAFSQAFVAGLGLRPSLLTTQIEPGDGLVTLFDALARLNRVLLDLAQDMWRYISDGVFRQRVVAGEVGSSTMPHKVNPIDFENAEGNLELADALFSLFARRLPVSRLQRDLSNSTVLRTIGVALGHSLLAYTSLRRGLSRVAPDEAHISAELRAHPEVITEAIQTILRREGRADAYDLLKEFSRGAELTLADLGRFIETLDAPEAVKAELRQLAPENYTGLAATLAGLIVPE